MYLLQGNSPDSRGLGNAPNHQAQDYGSNTPTAKRKTTVYREWVMLEGEMMQMRLIQYVAQYSCQLVN